jgi:hypothetical protein
MRANEKPGTGAAGLLKLTIFSSDAGADALAGSAKGSCIDPADQTTHTARAGSAGPCISRRDSKSTTDRSNMSFDMIAMVLDGAKFRATFSGGTT